MRLTIRDIQKLKDEQTPIVMMTAYDANSARISEQADIPMLLVGDSLGMVVQGHDSTIPVTLDHMIYHAEIVVRVTQKPLIVGDLPFMSYTISEEQAMTNSARMMQETGVSAVKLEGGVHIAPTVKRLTQAGIPVMGHIGLTPQSVNQFGGFRVQGRELETARRLLRDALAIQEAGAFSIVLELVPKQLAAIISEKLDIPTIGIGAGVGCDGQVQVFHDVLTLAGEFLPRHAKRYVDLSTIMRDALTQYVVDVKNRQFPDDSHVFTMKDEVITTLREEFK